MTTLCPFGERGDISSSYGYKKMALKFLTASHGIFKSSYIFMSSHYVTRAPIHRYANAAQLIFTQVYKWQLVQHRPCSSVVNQNLIFNCRAKIKTSLNKRNIYRIGTNDILKCTANGLLLLVVDTATLRHKLMASRAKQRSDDFGSP